MEYPFHDNDKDQLIYEVSTFATSGNISSTNYGDKYDPDKVDGHIKISIQINFPSYESQTIILNIQKNTIKEFSAHDKMKSTRSNMYDYKDTIIDADVELLSENITTVAHLSM